MAGHGISGGVGSGPGVSLPYPPLPGDVHDPRQAARAAFDHLAHLYDTARPGIRPRRSQISLPVVRSGRTVGFSRSAAALGRRPGTWPGPGAVSAGTADQIAPAIGHLHQRLAPEVGYGRAVPGMMSGDSGGSVR